MTDKKYDKKMKDKTDYKQDRVMSGYSPHKLIRLNIKKYLKRRKKEDDDDVLIGKKKKTLKKDVL
jgi:hypothetical protein